MGQLRADAEYPLPIPLGTMTIVRRQTQKILRSKAFASESPARAPPALFGCVCWRMLNVNYEGAGRKRIQQCTGTSYRGTSTSDPAIYFKSVPHRSSSSMPAQRRGTAPSHDAQVAAGP